MEVDKMKIKMTIKLNFDLVDNLKKLGFVDMTVENVIEDLVLHAQICDKYWDDRE